MFGENYRGLYSTQVGPRPTFSESLCAQSRVTSHLTLVKLDAFSSETQSFRGIGIVMLCYVGALDELDSY